MNRFDDLFDADQPVDELETELRAMFARRSEDITEPAAIRPGTDAPVSLLPRLASRATDVPGGLPGTLLAAAVVALLVLGSVLGVRGLEHRNSGPVGQPTLSTPTPRPTPSATRTTSAKSCPLPVTWATALAGGLVAVDQPQNYPASAGPDGSFLMQQTATGQVAGQLDFTHDELAIFDRNGHGTTIWTAADPAHDMVVVSPDSATSTDWVVYALTRSQNLAAYGVAAWNRATGQSTTVRLLSQGERSANTVIDFSPIVAGNTAYWIEQKYGNDASQTLVSQPLPAGTRSTAPVSQVRRLVAADGGVLLLRGTSTGPTGTTPDETNTLAAGPGSTVPAAVLAVGTGRYFVSDGSMMRWLSGDTDTTFTLLSWRPGQPAVTRSTVTNAPLGAQLVGPFLLGQLDLSGSGILFDPRTGTTLSLPAGLTLRFVTGSDLITETGTTKFGGSTVHRVPLSALPPARC